MRQMLRPERMITTSEIVGAMRRERLSKIILQIHEAIVA
jgi:hypothetical protein